LYLNVTGATSVVGTNGATFYITGVQLEVGTQATSFEYRQYGTELQLCQRYFTRLVYPTTSGNNSVLSMAMEYNSSDIYSVINYPTPMRTTPSLYQTSGSGYYVANSVAGNLTFNSLSALYAPPSTADQTTALVAVFSLSGLTAGRVTWLRGNNAASFIGLSAEL
jgi:hypothetical protein